jgi:probable rRNA maturation factor
MIRVPLTNEQTHLLLEPARLRKAVRDVLREAGILAGWVSLAVLDDRAIRRINRRYLKHDRPTDVLSFLLERSGGYLEGEVIVSAQRARAVAPQFGWTAADELLLYVIHGALHLVGCEDTTPPARAEMRRRERACLARFGLKPRFRRAEHEEVP